MQRSALVLGLLLALSPALAPAATEWAVFGTSSGGTQTGTFVDGRSVLVTAFTSGGGVRPAGCCYTSTPIVPGLADSANPPGYVVVTASGNLVAGGVAMRLDLVNFTVDADTLFGFSDMFQSYSYRMELLDAAGAALPLSGLQLTNYNLDLVNFEFDADFDVSLNTTTGALTVVGIHDANNGSTYRHSGLVLFGNLPATTRTIRILSAATFDQPPEGINFFFAGSVSEIPAPAAIWLVPPALLAVARFVRRR